MIQSDVSVSAREITKAYRRGKIGINTLRDELAERVSRKEPATSEKFKALDAVSFDLKRGRIYGILGRNGSGKSTLMKVLASITEPTSGEVVISGRVGSLLEVAAGFDDELSGYENIFLSGAILGMSRREIQKRLDKIIEFSGVRHLLETPVKRYSSGSYVRLGFAVVAHLDADVLLLDEFMTVADAPFREQAVDRLRGLASEGRTILIVSHELPILKKVCSDGLILDHGRLCAEGSFSQVSEIYSRLLRKEARPIEVEPVGQLSVGFDGSASNNRYSLPAAGRVKLVLTYEGSGESLVVECLVEDQMGVVIGSAISDYVDDGLYSVSTGLAGEILLDFSQLRDGDYVVKTRILGSNSTRILAQEITILSIGETELQSADAAAIVFPAVFTLNEY